jgi:hypothetical protein
LFHSQGLYVLGSQNWEFIWTGTFEHNLFEAGDPEGLAWLYAHFERKWNSPSEFR